MAKLVGFTYDLKSEYLNRCKSKVTVEDVVEFDTEITINEICEALEFSGYKVEKIGSLKNLLSKLCQGKRWDIVFNIAEGISGRNRESQVPLILEFFNIPYTGSDALSMGISLDKVIAKKIVSYHKILTPKFFQIKNLDQIKFNKINLKFPLIVKLSQDGSSKGLSKKSIVNNRNELIFLAKKMLKKYLQPLLVEEFIVGKEFTVVVMGNKYSKKYPVKSYPPVQIAINNKTNLGKEFFTYERIENDETKYICPSQEDSLLLKRLEQTARKVYEILDVQDFGRIDFRVDKNNKIYFLECNPLPHLGKIDVFPLVAHAVGEDYNKIISDIVKIAFDRYNNFR